MRDFINKAKDFANKHEKQVDQAVRKAGDMANRRTGGKYQDQIDKGVDRAQSRTGGGDQVR